MISYPVNYTWVNVGGIDTSQTNLLPRAAIDLGGWNAVRALEAEDVAFLVEGAVERFGEHCYSAQTAYRTASRSIDREPFSSVADDLYGMRNSTAWFKDRKTFPLADYEDLFGQNEVPPSYDGMFGIQIESSTSDFVASAPLDVQSVAKLYRDMRRFSCKCISGETFEVFNHTPLHSGANHLAPDTFDGAACLWSWGADRAGYDVMTAEYGTGNKNVVRVAGLQNPSGNYSVACAGFEAVLSLTVPDTPSWAYNIVQRGHAAKWIDLEHISGFPATLWRSSDKLKAASMKGIVEHFWGDWWSETWLPTKENVVNVFWKDVDPLPPGVGEQDGWLAKIAVVPYFRYISHDPVNMRTDLSDFMDADGSLDLPQQE